MTRSTGAQHRPVLARLLGPVDLLGEQPIRVRSERARTVLAGLAVRAGRLVSTATLIDAVWGDDPPRTASHALHVHVSTLRKLAPNGLAITGQQGGYTLDLGPGQLDTDLFEHLAGRARAELASGHPEAACRTFGSALALWRGAALADVGLDPVAQAEAHRWEEMRRAAEEDLTEAELAAGGNRAVVGELERRVAAEPFRERRWAQLMLALYRAGRQADALDRYRRLRALLAEELGIEPSEQLRELERAILRHDRSISPDAAAPLRPDTRFAGGRDGHLAFQVVGNPSPGGPSIVVVPGFGGNVELRWEEPNLARLYRRLARTARVVLYDKRGTGLSDREGGVPGVAEHAGDVLAVMDAAEVDRAVLFGIADGGAIAVAAAATHPDRVDGVVTYAAYAAFELLGPEVAARFDALRRRAIAGLDLDAVIPLLAPSRVGDPEFASWLGRYVRMATGVGGTSAVLERMQELDVRSHLPGVAAPLLALHRRGDRLIPAASSSYLAEHVRRGRAVLLPGEDTVIWAGDVDAIAGEVEAFLAESVVAPSPPAE